MDLRVVAVDSTGPHLIRVLRAATGAGTVVQALDPGSPAGLHRTWHDTGYVHDRATNPASTTSTGSITPPKQADEELWAREDLRAGDLARWKATAQKPGDFTIDLRTTDSYQRFEAWYLDPATAGSFVSGFGMAHGRVVHQVQDTDAGRGRFLVSFVPCGA